MSAAGPPLTRLLSATACVSPFHSQRTKGVGGPPGAHSSLSFPAAAAALTAGGQPGWAGAGAPYLPSPPPLPRHCGSLRHDGLVRGGGVPPLAVGRHAPGAACRGCRGCRLRLYASHPGGVGRRRPPGGPAARLGRSPRHPRERRTCQGRGRTLASMGRLDAGGERGRRGDGRGREEREKKNSAPPPESSYEALPCQRDALTDVPRLCHHSRTRSQCVWEQLLRVTDVT